MSNPGNNRTFILLLLLALAVGAQAQNGPLVGSTFLGGSGKDGQIETPMVIDTDGNIFVAGRTKSTDFPAQPGCYNVGHNGGTNDVFVAKFNSDVSQLLAATYLGGTGEDGSWPGVDLEIDSEGNVYVTGRTNSSDFPYDFGGPTGGYDVFITKFDNDLQSVLASRIFGGSRNEYYLQLALGSDGGVYVSGTTRSNSDFPILPGAFQDTYGGHSTTSPYPGDMFVCKFTSDLGTMLASTYLGGAIDEYCEEILVADDGNVYLCGWTASNDYYTHPTAWNRTHPHPDDYWEVFVTILSPDLSSSPASTTIGGNQWDIGYGMALADDGTIYITGHTASYNYPTTPGAWDEVYSGGAPGAGDDVFITQFDAALETVLASTYVGGSSWENGALLEFAESGSIVVGGWTRSSDFPATLDAYDPSRNGNNDFFVAQFTPGLFWREHATFIGSTLDDYIGGLAIAANGDVCVTGIATGSNYPVLETSYDDEFNGIGDPIIGEDFGGDVVVTVLPGGYFVDSDLDGTTDIYDNCPSVANMLQEDADEDAVGDSCDVCTDTDGDGYGNPGFPANICPDDNCPDVPNPDQSIDADLDGVGDICDNCIDVYNPDQADDNQNDIGDACETCCADRVGDANGSGEDEPTIGDVTVLIDAMFINNNWDVIPCLPEADINLSGGDDPVPSDITIGDVSYLIDYLFITGTTLTLPDCL
jgi:hypothetical protein